MDIQYIMHNLNNVTIFVLLTRGFVKGHSSCLSTVKITHHKGQY